MNTTNKPTTPSAALTPDEHKCGYICNHCKQHFPGYALYWEHKCKTAILPENSDAPTPETERAYLASIDDTGCVTRMEPIWDTMKRLERERDEARAALNIERMEAYKESKSADEARAELAKLKELPATAKWIPCNVRLPENGDRVLAMYKGVYSRREVTVWYDGGGNVHFGLPGEPDGKGSQPATHWTPLTVTPTPPTEGSAVEWVEERLFTQWDDDGNAQWYLCKTDALKLARRADLEVDNARQSREEIEELKGDIKAMAENNNEWFRRATEFEGWFNTAHARIDDLELVKKKLNGRIDGVEAEAGRIAAERDAAQAEARELREALLAMREYYKEHMITGKLHKQVEAALAKKEGER